jgi:hypothetical protein
LLSQPLPPDFFSTRVYPALEAARCRICHAPDGVASATRLHFPEKEATAAQIEAFGRGLRPLESLLADKPTNRVKHTGGQLVKPGSAEDQLLRQWADHLKQSAAGAAEGQPAVRGPKPRQQQLVRRLTHSQYNNTVRDLLGDFSKPAQRFPPEDYVDGFRNQLRNQSIPPLLAETYSTSAERLALNAFRAGDVNNLIPCKPATAADAACRDRFVKSFGLRAFRRPLTDAETRRYTAAFDTQARSTGKFLEGARVTVEAMLQSPKFLFHLESGPAGKSTDHAVASRLSYLIWDTMPGSELLAAAARGELRSADGRERIARKMLDNPLAAQALDEFFSQWLRLDKVLNATKEGRRFPQFTPEMAAAMVEETRRMLHHLVSGNHNFMELFTAGYSFLNAGLAALYGFPNPPGEFERVSFPPGTRRAGLLGHGSILTLNAGPQETSPTARGIFVREQLLCQHVPPPPPNVNTALPEPSEDKPTTRRQRLSAHVENPACSSCHKLMDPIGFGLENFDAIGRWRDKETVFLQTAASDRGGAPKPIELPLETGGEIAGLTDSAFADAAALGRILAASPVCQQCIVRQMFRYAYGRVETQADRPVIQQLTAQFRDSGFRFRELLIGLVRSPELVRGLDDNNGDATQ